ncbi:MAG: hypothetical protein QOD74_2510 [Variibacter sp.]|nr:hypothetical protein [Variibacter sp.]
MGIGVDTFAFHVTYTCPLACAHCCFSSSPEQADTLDPAYILAAIEELPEDIELVAFTGGEPFLHGRNLVRYVEAAKRRGFQTRIVTSGHFATSAKAAAFRLRPLADAGLDELSISWDDYHEAFVPFERIRTLVEVASQYQIQTAISSVQSNETKWTVDAIRAALGPLADGLRIVCESSLNMTGRAETALADSTFKTNGFLGPCPYVLTGPTMSAKGKLLACCGVIPDTDRLAIAASPLAKDIPALIEGSLSNPLYLYLYLRGPYFLMEQVAAKHGIPIPEKNAVGGNCEACKLLFGLPEIDSRIDDYLREKAVAILSEALLLDSLDLLGRNRLLDLWQDESLTRLDVASWPQAVPAA